MSKVERKDCVEHLSCALSEEEVAGYSQDMAGLHQIKLEVEDQKKEMTKDYGAKIQKIDADLHVLSRKITSKKEARDVNCFWEFDYTSGEKTLIRTDTSEIVKKETISAVERQRYIEFVEKKNKDGEISQAMQKVGTSSEKEKVSPKPKNKDVEKKDISCSDCGVPEGEKHSEGCLMLMPETEEPAGQEESGDGEPEVAEEEETPIDGVGEGDDGSDCFGTFDSNDAECANCERKEDCHKETIKPEGSETEEPAVEEAGESDEKPSHIYTCRKCEGGFDEPKDMEDEGIDDSVCPLCGAKDWL